MCFLYLTEELHSKVASLTKRSWPLWNQLSLLSDCPQLVCIIKYDGRLLLSLLNRLVDAAETFVTSQMLVKSMVLVLLFYLDCADVNVTPDKRQILLQHEALLLATIKVSQVLLVC
jgi:hypothetical protein